VLVIDIDPQANATAGLGINPVWLSRSMYDVFMSVVEGYPEISIRAIIRETPSGIDLAPSSLDMVGAEPFFYYIPERSHLLKRFISELTSYQYILIDTPPSMGQFVINGLVASDRAIITFDQGIFALNGLKTLRTIFDDIKEYLGEEVHADMAILTRSGPKSENSATSGIFSALKRMLGLDIPPEVEQETLLYQEIEDEMKKCFEKVYSVPFNPQIPAAQRRGLPISHYDPACDAAKAYESITREVMTWE
jgi:chromosome partitioning protein